MRVNDEPNSRAKPVSARRLRTERPLTSQPNMLTDSQKSVAQAIVNVFDTGTAVGRYGSVAVIPGDPGHLTYGRSQTTLASGNLSLLISAYCRADDAEFGPQLRPYLDRLMRRDLSLDGDAELKKWLRLAGEDRVMQTVQDAFFDRVYWGPAQVSAIADGVETALGAAVVYDGFVHGSWGRVRSVTGGSAATIGERAWIPKYVSTRRHWLASHPNALLHKTVYRMDAFKQLVDEGNWDLVLPIRVAGVVIDDLTLPGCSGSAEDPKATNLLLLQPFLSGARVLALQEALRTQGISLDVDGIFGTQTDAAVRLFQSHRQLTIDGIVGPATRVALAL